MSDLISKRSATERLIIAKTLLETILQDMPSAQLERPRGKWILVKGSNGKDYHKCSECLHTQDITGVKNYCPVCGADMEEEDDSSAQP